MLEHELNPAATKFIASLVKSLQILCNGQVDFNESIELIGHINVRVDRIHKINYIVDEHVSKEGNDSSTTFLSNSYHSFPPTKSLPPPQLIVSQHDPQPIQHQQHPQQNVRPDIPAPRITHAHTVKVSHKLPNLDSNQKPDNVMVKMEGNDNDCMVLPASPEDYEQVEDIGPQEGGTLPGTSSAPSESFEMDYDMHNNRITNQTAKKRRADDQNPEEGGSETKIFSRNCKYLENDSFSQQSSGLFYCNHCGQGFYNENQLQFHQFNCKAAIQFSTHRFQENAPISSTDTSCIDIDGTDSCSVCGYEFQNNKEKLHHMNTEHGVSLFSCPSCPEVFVSFRILCQHKKLTHGGSAGHLSCSICEKSFTTPLNLKGHMNTHMGLKPYTCNVCGEAFAYSQSKHRHQKLCRITKVPPPL